MGQTKLIQTQTFESGQTHQWLAKDPTPVASHAESRETAYNNWDDVFEMHGYPAGHSLWASADIPILV